MNALVDILVDILARVVAIREATEDGDNFYAADLVRDLEHDLAREADRARAAVDHRLGAAA